MAQYMIEKKAVLASRSRPAPDAGIPIEVFLRVVIHVEIVKPIVGGRGANVGNTEIIAVFELLEDALQIMPAEQSGGRQVVRLWIRWRDGTAMDAGPDVNRRPHRHARDIQRALRPVDETVADI